MSDCIDDYAWDLSPLGTHEDVDVAVIPPITDVSWSWFDEAQVIKKLNLIVPA